jgi:serine/threonine protein kinase
MDPATTASDIWSLGCTVIELLTGFPPYFDNPPMSAIYKMVNDSHPPFPDDISPVSPFLFRRFPPSFLRSFFFSSFFSFSSSSFFFFFSSSLVTHSVLQELYDFLVLCFKKNPSDRASAEELLSSPWIAMYSHKITKKKIEVTQLQGTLQRYTVLRDKKETASSAYHIEDSQEHNENEVANSPENDPDRWVKEKTKPFIRFHSCLSPFLQPYMFLPSTLQ